MSSNADVTSWSAVLTPSTVKAIGRWELGTGKQVSDDAEDEEAEGRD